MSLRPDLLAGRCPDAASPPTANDRPELLLFFEISSSYVRCRLYLASGLGACHSTIRLQELNFSEEQIHPSDALVEMSQWHWEGCQKSKNFTPEMITIWTTMILAHWESLQHRQRQVGVPRKKSGKSRLQIVSSSGDHEADDEMLPITQAGIVGERSQTCA